LISLDRLLDGLEVEAEPFVVHDLRRECTPSCGPMKPALHCTRSGSGVVELAGGATVRFSRHNVIVLPPRRRAGIVPERSTVGARMKEEAGTSPKVVTACGAIRATYQGSVGLFDQLREPIVENFAADDPIHRSFQDLMDEIAGTRAGSRAMVETVVRRCLILLMRRHFRHVDARTSWLVGLDDVRLGRAMALMHDRPQQSFTLRALAEVAGMSRSVFAARFADAVGQSPIEFLKMLRLARASQLLMNSDLPVKTVAARVGYSSRSSFTRAFHAHHGIGPTAFRTAAHEPAIGPFVVEPTPPDGAAEVA